MSQVPAYILNSVDVLRRRRAAQYAQQTQAAAAAPAPAPPIPAMPSLSSNAQVAGLQRLTWAMGVNAATKDLWIAQLMSQVKANGRSPSGQPAPWNAPRKAQGTGIAAQIDGLVALRDAMAKNAAVKDLWIAALMAQVKSLGKTPAPQPREYVTL